MMTLVSRALILCSALVTALPGVLGAQESDSARTRADSIRRANLPPIVVTGTASPGAIRDLGLAVTVLGHQELRMRAPLYAIDLLRDAAGTHVDEAVGPGGPAIVRLRGGEEVYTQILMDGTAINQNGGFFDFQGFPLTNVERVEIVRGPQSVVYGSSAMSGVVQYLTQSGTPGRPRVDFELEGSLADGEGDGGRGAVAVRGGSRALLYSIGVGATYHRGIFAVANDAWTRDASVRLDVLPATAWRLTGLFRYVEVESNLPVRDAGATRVPLDPNARNTRQRVVGSLEASFQATPTWAHRLRISAYREDFQYRDMFDDVASTGTYDFFIFDANFALESRLWRTAASYTGTNTFAMGANRHALSLSYGASTEREDLRDRTAGDFGNDTLGLDRMSGAGLAEAQVRIGDRFHVMAGARVDAYEGIDAAWSPRATATVHLVPGVLLVRGGIGRAFKAPNLQQQYLDNPFIVSNPDLTPETSTSWEVGTGLSTRGGAGSVELTFFRQRVADMIQLAPSGDTTRLQYRNLSATRVQGMEASARIRPHRAWFGGIDVTWLGTRLLDNAGLDGGAFPADSALPYRPDLVGGGFVEWSPSPGVAVRARARYVGEQIALTERFSGARAALDPYVLIGLNVTARPAAFASVYLRIDNLFSKYYEPGYATPGAARSVAVGLRITH
jgi:vitamin B12 transporter